MTILIILCYLRETVRMVFLLTGLFRTIFQYDREDANGQY